VENRGDTTVVVTSADPLPNGRTKVLWALRGADGHKMTGSLSFTITAPAASPTSAAPNGVAPATTATTATPPASVVATSETETQSITADNASSSGEGSFDVAELIGVVARWLVYAAILLTVGALAYLLWVHRGSRAEGRRIVFFIRRASVVVIIGSIIEWFANLALRGSGSLIDLVSISQWGDLVASSFAIGTLLRIVGAVLVLRFVAIEVVPDRPVDESVFAELDWISEPDAYGALLVEKKQQGETLSRVRVESGPLALLGALLLIVSESFIGHTASVEPRALVVVSDAIHLSAAGVWAAGAWLLALTLWRRRRRGEPVAAGLLATRFSLLATWSLLAVAISGLALSWAILESVSALWSSEFGRLLVAKIVVVAVIGFFGLHNRQVLLPAITCGDEAAEERFRRTIAIEAVLFVVVLFITSLLVIANPFA